MKPSTNSTLPYRENLEHLMDICLLMRQVIEKDLSSFKESFNSILEKEKLSEVNLPIVKIKERFSLNTLEYICLLLSIGAIGDDGIGNAILKESGTRNPSFGMALSLFSHIDTITSDSFTSLAEGKPLSFLMKIEGNGILAKRFMLREEVFYFAAGKLIPNYGRITVLNKFPIEPLPLYSNEKKELSAIFANTPNDKILFVIAGKKGSGRRTLAVSIAFERGYKGFFINLVGELDEDTISELVKRVTAISVISKGCPIIISNTKDYPNADNFIGKLPPFVKRVFLIIEKSKTVSITDWATVVLEMPPLSRDDGTILWEHFGKGLDFDYITAANRYNLTVERIKAVLASVRKIKCKGGVNDLQLIRKEVGRQNIESDLLRLVTPKFGIDDLIINPKTKNLLKQITLTMIHRQNLYNNYGYKKLFPYGRGVGVLFYGVSGTGKTMAAQILGMDLGLDLMIVDLSRIVDKYIGETEKRITEIFDTAKANNGILFFDEADSLFSKRTDVGDSRDRHANSQTAHLLQKMEEHDGLVILATNLFDNIDDAFKRRLPFIVEFSRPNSDLRRLMWEQFIPTEMPSEKIDYGYLGETFELTPAVIKWTAFSSAVRASAEESALSMEHIIQALKYEYEKNGADFPNKPFETIIL